MLARREHSAFELKQKLSAKGFAREAQARVLAWLTETGLQSDERFTEVFVRSRRGRGLGPQRIAQELRERGIAEELAAAYLDRNDPDWQDACREVAEAKFGRRPPKDYREKGQRARFLHYRGFSPSQINRVLRGGSGDDEDFASADE
ncbi:MAG: regulatory protein RecX [Gammaproteobacteria bacterium]|nr:regulatory protein RecX [Gammaproteobacteria bacterium]